MGRRIDIESEREYNRQYRAKHKDKLLDQQIVRRRKEGQMPRSLRTTEDKRKYWRERKRLYRGRAKKAVMNHPRIETINYIEILKRDPCSFCGQPWRATDHIKALNKDGEGDWTNLTATCTSCNSRKQDKSLLEFMVSTM